MTTGALTWVGTATVLLEHGGSTVLTAANIQVIARARASASSGSRPG